MTGSRMELLTEFPLAADAPPFGLVRRTLSRLLAAALVVDLTMPREVVEGRQMGKPGLYRGTIKALAALPPQAATAGPQSLAVASARTALNTLAARYRRVVGVAHLAAGATLEAARQAVILLAVPLLEGALPAPASTPPSQDAAPAPLASVGQLAQRRLFLRVKLSLVTWWEWVLLGRVVLPLPQLVAAGSSSFVAPPEFRHHRHLPLRSLRRRLPSSTAMRHSPATGLPSWCLESALGRRTLRLWATPPSSSRCLITTGLLLI